MALDLAKKHGLSRRQLSLRSGVSYSTLQNWHDGLDSPMLPNLEAVLNTVGYKLTITRMD